MQHTGETTALAAGGTNRGREAVTSSPKGGDDVTEATEEKPRPGPEGENRHNRGRPQTPEGEDCKHRGVAGYGGKENRRSLRSCGGGGGRAKCDENHI